MSSISAFSLTINSNSQPASNQSDISSSIASQFQALLASFTSATSTSSCSDSNDNTANNSSLNGINGRLSTTNNNASNDPAQQFMDQLLAMLENLQQDNNTGSHRHHHQSIDQTAVAAQPDPTAAAPAVNDSNHLAATGVGSITVI